MGRIQSSRESAILVLTTCYSQLVLTTCYSQLIGRDPSQRHEIFSPGDSMQRLATTMIQNRALDKAPALEL
jgi:hypothetical protein